MKSGFTASKNEDPSTIQQKKDSAYAAMESTNKKLEKSKNKIESKYYKAIKVMYDHAMKNNDADLFLQLADLEPNLEYIFFARVCNRKHDFFKDNKINKYIEKHAESLSAIHGSIYIANLNMEIKPSIYNYQVTIYRKAQKWLLNIIANNPIIKKMTVDLYTGNYIDEKFAIFLSNATYLEFLDTESLRTGYRIESTQAKHIAKGLTKNTALKILNLCDQPIGDEGLLAILDALKENPQSKLEFINLACCKLTDLSAEALLKHLQENNSLLKVNIYGNYNISDELVHFIELAIQQKQLSANATNSQIDIIIDEPSPGPITYAYMESKNNEQEIERTNTNDMDYISKKRNYM